MDRIAGNTIGITKRQQAVFENLYKETSTAKWRLRFGRRAFEAAIQSQLSSSRYPWFSLAAMVGDKDEDKPLENHLQSSPYNFGKPLFASSGIVVSAPKIKDDKNDGYLTGEEILTADLSKVNLVVLSACNTGRGQKFPMEGVFSIDRSFRIAGARTTLSNIYPVSDKGAVKYKLLLPFSVGKKTDKT